MESKNKNLILISGATGSIGSSFFEQFILEHNYHVVGLSRSGLKTQTIPNYHSIIHFDFEDMKSYEKIRNLIKTNDYKKIVYVHTVGKFQTEIIKDKKGFSEPEKGKYDNEITKLTFDYTAKVVDFLLAKSGKNTEIVAVNIGSLSDEFDIPVFQSWRHGQTQLLNFFGKKIEEYKNFSALTVRVSTILGAKELVDRPYLFGTNTDPQFWLPKTELVAYIKRRIKYSFKGSKIENLFRSYPKFDNGHWDNKKTFIRRVQELYDQKIKA